MNRFRKVARNLVARIAEHRITKAKAKQNGKISSIGTERAYRQAAYNFVMWCHTNSIHSDYRANILTIKQYLEERREWVQQKTLDQERQALKLIFKQNLPYLRSLKESVYDKRSYSIAEANIIIVHHT